MKCKTCGKDEQSHNRLYRQLVDEFEDKTAQKVDIACRKIPESTITDKVFNDIWTKARAESYYEIVRSSTIDDCVKKKFIGTVGDSIGYALP